MFQINTQVFLSSSDENGALRFDAAMDMMQDCSVLWTETESTFKQYLIDNNLVMILVNRQADVIRMPLYKEKLAVQTTIYECKGAFGMRNTVIYDEEHKPCVVSWATGAFVSIDTARPFRLPREINDSITIDPKIDMEYLGRRIDVPGAEGKTIQAGAETENGFLFLPPLAVTSLDIDINRHMNNGRYIKIAMGFLNDDFVISRFRVEYKKPAVKNDQLYPIIKLHPVIKHSDPDRIYILLTDKNGEQYAVMEFWGK
ncbi:acyl-ACP thioesterase [Spirochaetia bacterium]|nr:acyl-ACP thioesterase [Spirochaetia bacterium]